METSLLDLVRTLPAELRASAVTAIVILIIGGTGVGLVEFAFRKDLLSLSNARRLSLLVIVASLIGATILIISLVALRLWDTFGGASPI